MRDSDRGVREQVQSDESIASAAGKLQPTRPGGIVVIVNVLNHPHVAGVMEWVV